MVQIQKTCCEQTTSVEKKHMWNLRCYPGICVWTGMWNIIRETDAYQWETAVTRHSLVGDNCICFTRTNTDGFPHLDKQTKVWTVETVIKSRMSVSPVPSTNKYVWACIFMRYEKKKYNKRCLQSSSFLHHVILFVQYLRLLSQGNYRSQYQVIIKMKPVLRMKDFQESFAHICVNNYFLTTSRKAMGI